MDGTHTEPEPGAASYQIVTDSERLVTGLSLVAFVLLLVHSVITVYHYQIEELE